MRRYVQILALALLGLIAQGPAMAQDVIKAHGISTFGALKYPADFPHFDYVNPDAPKGGTFSTWAFGSFDSMTPYILKGNAAALSTILYDTLMTGNLDEPDAMYGLLAESVEYPPSREWAIFHLRPQARFADGTPVRASDVVFSFYALRDQGAPAFKVAFRDFQTVEALDETRVKFTFNPDGPLRELILTAAGLPVLSAAYYETRDFAESTIEAPLGSGPYALGDIRPGQTVTYQRRDDYWGKDLPVNRGQNNFDQIKIEYFADYTTAFEAFKGGAYTFREEFMSKIWATGYDFPAIQDGRIIRETLADGRPAGTQGLFFNLRREKFADPQVREAIAMAFNFEWSNQSLFHGLYARTDSFWENAADLQANGPLPADEAALLEPLRDQLPASVFDDPAVTPPIADADNLADRRLLRRASRLLTAAGWDVGDDGLRRNADGDVLSIRILNDSPGFDRIFNPYVDNLKRLGIDAAVTRVEAAQAQEREKEFDFDMVTSRYSMSLTPGEELHQIFGSRAANVPGSRNLAGLANPAVDRLIEIITSAQTRDELNVAVRALDRVLRALHIWVPQWYKGVHNIAYRDIYARPYGDTPPPKGMGELSIWWLDPAKAAAAAQ
jgi:microcin C transport system substrate-binding protein